MSVNEMSTADVVLPIQPVPVSLTDVFKALLFTVVTGAPDTVHDPDVSIMYLIPLGYRLVIFTLDSRAGPGRAS